MLWSELTLLYFTCITYCILMSCSFQFLCMHSLVCMSIDDMQNVCHYFVSELPIIEHENVTTFDMHDS